MSEYFKIVRKEAARPVFYAAVVARSYAGVNQREKVRIDGWTYSPEYLRSGDKVLIVDDIYDSGRTINHLAEVILAKGLPGRTSKSPCTTTRYASTAAIEWPSCPTTGAESTRSRIPPTKCGSTT